MYSGLELSTDVDLPEFATSHGDDPAILRLVTRYHQPIEGTTRQQRETDVGIVMASTQAGDKHRLAFGSGNVFEFERPTRTITCPEPLDSTARHQLLDHVLPRVLDDLGHLMVHGSAVDTASGAVIFIGDTGLGKSTLAASFQNHGTDLLSDDCMRLTTDAEGRIRCVPTYRSLRLWPDSADAIMPIAAFEPMAAESNKRRIAIAAGPTNEHRIAAICVLAPPHENSELITLTPLAPARSVGLLLAQCFRLDPTDAVATTRTFERCADVVERVPVIELSYPREFERLSEVREAVLQRLARGDRGPITPT